MSQVEVKTSILQWAIQRQGSAISKLKKKFPNIENWLLGESSPTLTQLEAFAKATNTPLGFFFLDNPPQLELSIPHFRTVTDETPKGPSPDLLDTVHSMERRQAFVREYLIEHGNDALPFVGSAEVNENSKSVAAKIRNVLNLKEDWASKSDTWSHALSVLRETIEESGVIVAVNGIVGNNTKRVLNVDEFRGFVLCDSYAPLIFVNGADGKAAQMFTLAHELAHVFMGKSAAFDLHNLQVADDPTEKACNEAAAEFLVPEVALRDLWSKVKATSDPYQIIARHFKVSYLVAIRRAQDLGFINKATFFDLYENYVLRERKKERTSKGGNFYASQNLRIGNRFGRILLQALTEGRLLYSEAYRLTGLSGNAFTKFAKTKGVDV